LIVADIDTMNLVAFRVADITIEASPAEAKRSYEDIIEEIDIDGNDRQSAYPPSPTRQAL
jgi:hypothetical protein